MAVEKIRIKLENEQGKKVTYTAKKVKARVVFNAMKLFSNFEKEDYNEAQGVEDMLTLVADDILCLYIISVAIYSFFYKFSSI